MTQTLPDGTIELIDNEIFKWFASGPQSIGSITEYGYIWLTNKFPLGLNDLDNIIELVRLELDRREDIDNDRFI